MRRRFSVIVSVMLLAIFGGLFLKQNASAYWSSSNGKECFAIRYGWSNAYKREGKAAADGNVDEYQGEWKAYSTPMVCATKDSKGKITLKTSGYPADNDNIAADGTIRLKASKQTVQLTVCKRSGPGCDKTTPKSFKLSDYKNFKALAKAVVNAAPQKYGKATKGDLNDKITKTTMKEQADKKIEALKAGTTGDGTDNTATATGASGDPCFNANTNSLGWIMCPVMRTLENTAEWLNSMVEEWLSVDTSLYNANSPTASVWETMRNIANIIMVIILLVIIFSQLTGVGIDNYGIKKMLPRLIAMAILINLSLVICELAIDVSNLLGTGLKNLFGEIGKNLLAEKGTSDYMGNFVSTMVTSLLAMVAGLGAIAPIGLTVASIPFSSGGMMIVVLVLALLVVVAAVLVFFVMLGARMVIIIGCVAVAPVALAFYILPNTQELYKKWLNAFKTALVVFPICGAVSGVGMVIRAIVLSADEIQVWMGVIGIIAPFLAFFMLPSMLRGVLGTLGRVGEALTTMGQGVRSGASSIRDTARSTDRYKNGLADAKEAVDFRRAQRVHNRLSGRTNLTDKQLRQLRRSEDTMVNYENNRLKDRAAGNTSNFQARVAAMQAKDYEEGLDNDIALLRQNGINGQQYGLDSIRDRLNYLSNRRDENGNQVALSGEERREVAVLTRAALGEKGGGGAVGAVMRNDSTSTDFKNAMGDALQNDTASRAKLSEKDAAAGLYAESFMQNGSNRGMGPSTTFSQFADNHQDDINQRVNTHEAGLSQSGAALNEYINNLTPQQSQDIYDTEAYKVLSRDDYARFRAHAESQNVYGKSPQRVSVNNGGNGSGPGSNNQGRNTGGSWPDNANTETWD